MLFPSLVLGIAVLIGLYLIGRGLFGLDPKRALKIVVFFIVLSITIGGVILLFRSGASLVYIIGGLLLPLLLVFSPKDLIFLKLVFLI